MLIGMIIWSDMFRVDFGVRQCSVLLPYLFALYLDALSGLCLSACVLLLYVYDILLMSPSIWRLEKLLCLQKELHWLYVAIKFNRAVYAWSSL